MPNPFDDILGPKAQVKDDNPFADILPDPVKPAGPVVTGIRPPRPISPLEIAGAVFRPQINALRTAANPQANIVDRVAASAGLAPTSPFPYQDSIAQLGHLPTTVAVDQLTRAAEGRPRPLLASTRDALAGFPGEDKERQAFRTGTQLLMEAGALRAVPALAREITKAPGEALQRDLLKAVKEARLAGKLQAPEHMLAESAEVPGYTDYDIAAVREIGRQFTPGQVEMLLKERSIPNLVKRFVGDLFKPKAAPAAGPTVEPPPVQPGQQAPAAPRAPLGLPAPRVTPPAPVAAAPAPPAPPAAPAPAAPKPNPFDEIIALSNKTIDVPNITISQGKIPVRYEGEQEGLGSLVTELEPVGEGKFRLGSTKVLRPETHQIVTSRAGKTPPTTREIPESPQSVIEPAPANEISSPPGELSPSQSQISPSLPGEKPGEISPTVAEPAQEAAQSQPPEALKPAASAYSASRYNVQRLYHETSPDNAVDIATGSGDLSGLQVSPEHSLALGQTGKGAVIEFGNVEQIDVRPMRSKPGAKFIEAQGGIPPEMSILKAPFEGGRIVASVTFKPGTPISAASKARMQGWGWTKEALPDGSVKFVNPRLTQPPTTSLSDAASGYEPSGDLQETPTSGKLPARRTTPHERQTEFEFRKQLLAEYGPGGKAGEVPAARGSLAAGRPGDTRTLGLAIHSEIVKTGRVDLRGKLARTPRDIALLAQVFRDPRFETFRIFYMRGQEIIAHEAFTSRLPGSTAAFTGPKDWSDMSRRMSRLKADGYYVLHNHPSGDPTPSEADAKLTATMAKRLRGLRGHVVINSKRYVVMNARPRMPGVVGYEETIPDTNPQMLEPSQPNKYLGRSIATEADIAILAVELKQAGNWVSLFHRESRGTIRAIQETHPGFFKVTDQFSGYLKNRQRDFGSPDTFALYTGKDEAVIEAGRDFVEAGALRDFIYEDEGGRLRSVLGQRGSDPQIPREVVRYRVGEEQKPYNPKPVGALVKTRRAGIAAIMRDLREQAVLLNQARLELRALVARSGGIKPTVGGQLRQELQAIRPYLRNSGQEIDVLATELGYSDGEALREALIAARSAKIPSMREIRAQAERIIDSEQGNRILEVVSGSQATTRTIKRVVRDVAREMDRDVAASEREIRRIVAAAQKKGLTPAQVARFARLQRAEPGEVIVGPRGGESEAPLSPADVERVEGEVEGIVPRNISEKQRAALEAGKSPRLPAGPNQPPPIIPTNRALVPANLKPKRDIPIQWTRATAEQDMQRIAQYVDGKLLGPVNKQIVQPVIEADTRAMAKAEAKLAEFKKMAAGIKKDSESDARMIRAVEERPLPGEKLTDQERELSDAWEAFAKKAIEDDINPTLERLGKSPIAPRKNYAPHLPAMSFLSDLFGGLEFVPDDLLEKLPLLRDVMETPIGQRDPSLPQAVRDLPYVPKHQSAFFLKPRVGGPFRESLLAGISAYVPLWARITEVAPVVHGVKALLKQMPPNFRAVAEQWLGEQMGKKPKMDTITDARAINALRRFNHMSAASLIVGRASTVLLQYSSLANTAARHGWFYTLRGFRRALTPEGRGLAERFSRELQERMEVGTLLEGDHHSLRVANAALEFTDQQMVTTAFLAALEDYLHMSPAKFEKLTGSEKTPDNIFTMANISTEQTQASMRKALQSPVTRSQLLRAVASNLQTFTINLRQQALLDPQILALARNKKAAALYEARLIGNMLAMNMVYKFFGLRPPTEISDFIPVFDPLTGAVPIGVIGKAVQSGGRFIPVTALVAAVVFKLAKDLQENGKLSRPTMRDLWKVLVLPIPGGSQLVTTAEGLLTVRAGGRRNKRDPTRYDYRVQGIEESIRAVTLGPYATRGYREFRQRGFRPPNLTEEEKAARRLKKRDQRMILESIPSQN